MTRQDRMDICEFDVWLLLIYDRPSLFANVSENAGRVFVKEGGSCRGSQWWHGSNSQLVKRLSKGPEVWRLPAKWSTHGLINKQTGKGRISLDTCIFGELMLISPQRASIGQKLGDRDIVDQILAASDSIGKRESTRAVTTERFYHRSLTSIEKAVFV